MRQYRGSSGAKRQADRRQQLIDAAILVYGEVGHARASVRRICQAAGLTERYFYESFANGGELLVAAFEYAADAFEYQLLALGSDAGQRTLLTAYLEALRDHPVLSRLFVIEARSSGGPIVAGVDDAIERFGRTICGIPQGQEMADERRILLIGLSGGLFHIGERWISEDFATPLDAVLDAAERLCSLIDAPEINKDFPAND